MRRKHSRTVSRLLLTLGFLVVAIAWASAQCDCAGPHPDVCTLLGGQKAVFLGTLVEKTANRFHFRVDEGFTGVKDGYFDLEPFPCGYEYFKEGGQYVVFVDALQLADGEHLFAHQCGPTRAAKYGHALVEQLRAERNGRRVASVYGTLLRTLQPEIGIWDENYVRPVPDVTVRLRWGKKSFETKTNEDGAYSFEQLPAGTYRVSADLPPNLELAQWILNDPVPPFVLPAHSCYDYNLHAMPVGEIDGRVIGPDGTPLPSTSANLYRAGSYKDGEGGMYAYQEEGKPFRFRHLPAGDYILVFNDANGKDPDVPFSRTFYPGADDLRSSKVIHLEEGQKVVDADIRIKSAGLPTRKLAIRLDWNGRHARDYYPPSVQVNGSEGTAPYPYKVAADSYQVNLLLNASYTIRAEAFCRTSKVKAESSVETVSGGNAAISELTLTFNKGECSHK